MTPQQDAVALNEDDDHATHHRYRLDTGPGDGLARIRRVRDNMPARAAWTDAGVIAAAVELPFSAGKMANNDRLMMCAGAILACLPPWLPVAMLRADDWRAACGLPIRGAREQHKRAALEFALERWENAPAGFNDNAADAFCIAWACRELARRRETIAA